MLLAPISSVHLKTYGFAFMINGEIGSLIRCSLDGYRVDPAPEEQSGAAADQADQHHDELTHSQPVTDQRIRHDAKSDPEQLLPLVGVIPLGKEAPLRPGCLHFG